MTDITRLITSLKRRSAHSKDFGDDVTFVKLEDLDALVEALEKAQAINAAAEKLVRCKGRYHSEQNYLALSALFGVTTPDLPPLDSESRTVTVKLPKDHVDDADLFGWGVIVVPLEALKEACADAGVTVEITDAGIKWEAE